MLFKRYGVMNVAHDAHDRQRLIDLHQHATPDRATVREVPLHKGVIHSHDTGACETIATSECQPPLQNGDAHGREVPADAG